MPVTVVNLTPALTSALTGAGVKGTRAPALAAGIAQAIPSALRVARVQTVATGVTGVGIGTGKITLDPVSGTALLSAALTANGLVGFLTPRLASGIIQGLASVLNTQALVSTTVAAISTGTGVGRLFAVTPATLTPLFLSGLTGVGFLGARAPALAAALGQGISSWLGTGVITTAIAGTPTVPPVAAIGTGVGVIF